jgi:hypothetical protein
MTKSQTTNATRITNIRVTPVAFRDPPLLNAVGVHQPFAIRRLHEQYLACGITERSDTLYMQSLHPDYRAELPRW